MNRYTLLGEYTLGEGQKSDTCQHCGRAIKSVYVVHDNIENTSLKVGMVCIGKMMNLNESFEKSLIKELKKYSTLLKKVNNFNIESELKEWREDLIKFNSGIITKTNKYFGGVVWDDSLKSHRALTLEEFDNDIEKRIETIKLRHDLNVENLRVQVNKLNALSKKGLIKIEL